MASGKAIDAVYGVQPPSTAEKLRELFYSAHFLHSHIAHFYVLAAPDFIAGPGAAPSERNILGVINKVGVEKGNEVIKHRAYAQEIQSMLGGKATHPAWVLPGGVSKGLTEEERISVQKKALSCLEFARSSLDLFEEVVLKNRESLDLIFSEGYRLVTNYMGLVDSENKVNFYKGKVRVVDPGGEEIARYDPPEYLEHIEEHVEPWTYLKFPYLKKLGWQGFVEGKGSGIYQAAPLARLNAAEGMATPLAQEAYEKFFETLGGKPAHAILSAHWARLVEMLYAAERMLELSKDEEITGEDYRLIPENIPGEGVGIIEAPRGTLTHHYKTDERGIVKSVNLVVGTTNNHAPIHMAVKKAAQSAIKPGVEITNGLLNKIEMAFRSYDPCLSCATHAAYGEMPLQAVIYDHKGSHIKTLQR